MRQEHKTHTTEDWHNSPLPEGSSRALTVPPGRGGGALWRAEQTKEAIAVLGALEAMAVQGALEAMAELGALEAMAVQGALEAMAVQGALEVLVAVASAPSAQPVQSEPFLPPKFPWGSLGVSGALRG